VESLFTDMQRSKKAQLLVGKRSVEVSNLDKVLYPAGRFSKGDVIDYYISISKYLLPHLKDHPVTLKRFPDGVFGEFFYDKDAPAFTPSWVKTFAVPRKQTTGPDIRYVLVNELATLVWLANLANLEIHSFLHCAPRIERPTSIVFDCDPGEGADILSCVRVALSLRALLTDLNLESFAKVSGSKGVQVYVPLNTPVTYRETRGLAKALAELLERRQPKLIVSQMAKALRANKVFIDWSQNAEFKTTVSVYSLRAKSHRPHVSMPVKWEELDYALKRKNAEELFFAPQEAIKRTDALGDIFRPVLEKTQHIPADVRGYFKESSRTSSTRRRKENSVAIQRSRQGSRRGFVVYKDSAMRRYSFGLEMSEVVKCWSLAQEFPRKKSKPLSAKPAADVPVERLNSESKRRQKREEPPGLVWDAGTYNLIEGNYAKGFLRFYLNGAKLKGEWTLQRPLATNRRHTWRLEKSDSDDVSTPRKKDALAPPQRDRKRRAGGSGRV
jgi:bifunctional non-homologous end joining protein LigD